MPEPTDDRSLTRRKVLKTATALGGTAALLSAGLAAASTASAGAAAHPDATPTGSGGPTGTGSPTPTPTGSGGTGTASPTPTPTGSSAPPVTKEQFYQQLSEAQSYWDSLGLGNDPYDPNINDSDGLVTYINATTNNPPPELVKDRVAMSRVLEGLTGIVAAAVLKAAGSDDAAKHKPDLWTTPMEKGFAPFMGGFTSEITTYDRTVRGLDIATQFLNILIDAVSGEGGQLAAFKSFLTSQGETMRIYGGSSTESYQYACVGIVHEMFQVEDGEWVYVPKIRAYFTSFTKETWNISVGCASAQQFHFAFRVEKFVTPFKLETWRDEDWFREEVDNFINKYTKAQIDESENYFDGIFESKVGTA
ncbi:MULTISPECIES: hypothetical protein [unclassified Streptomyces]|uniref:hypothetical protein n=1 Tax=unclassified Streptomyces TaxID=2593676 RepID=UPI002E2C9A17|nr:hypothetical protein [Streptomyces sp. NBC_00223]